MAARTLGASTLLIGGSHVDLPSTLANLAEMAVPVSSPALALRTPLYVGFQTNGSICRWSHAFLLVTGNSFAGNGRLATTSAVCKALDNSLHLRCLSKRERDSEELT